MLTFRLYIALLVLVFLSLILADNRFGLSGGHRCHVHTLVLNSGYSKRHRRYQTTRSSNRFIANRSLRPNDAPPQLHFQLYSSTTSS